jgi:phenylacetic acid degradation operon negative regulatory protein
MDPLAPLIASLNADGRVRVWSLVITVFGDLIQHRGGAVSSARLGQLLGRVGVEPGAVRTALSRLTRDGWVSRQRTGRSSLYRLSVHGLARFAPATSRIYASPRLQPVGEWALVLTLQENGVPRAVLQPADRQIGPGDCCLIGRLAHLSEPYRQVVIPEASVAALAALAGDIAALDAATLVGVDAAAARMLLIHRWRRIVLRFPEPEPELLPEGIALANPRQAVAQAYGRLSAPTEAWLDAPAGEAPGLPPADASFARRFADTREA